MLPLAVTVGAAAGVIRERTGSVTGLIILHAVQNAAVVAGSLAATGWHATLPM
jgi:membrane protease YdiL (CAAX protease family)